MKKLVALLLSAMMLCVCCAALAEYPAVVEGIDFGGAEVQVLDYWSGDGARNANPTEEQAAQYAYRDWINATYNVNIHQLQGGDWGTCAEEMINFTGTPDGSLRLYIIEPGKVGSLVANGIAAPISDKYVDLNAKKWNAAEKEFMTVGGKLYGLYSGNSEPRGCLYFNKRVLQEAGIDWNTIYDLQKEGKWTWAAFEDMLKTITRDTDNDGVNDIYGLIGNSDTLYMTATFAGGGTFFDYDKDDKLQPTMGSTAATSAMDWATIIKDTYWAQKPEDASWDWYKEAWKAGTTAFYIGESYEGFNGNDSVNEVDDEWGAVAFPTPTESTKFVTGVNDNITLIPAAYDAETVAALAEIYDKFTDPAPGYESEDSWIGNKYELTDKRAVEETYAMLRQDEHAVANKTSLLGNVNTVLGQNLLWLLGGEETAAEIIEQSMSVWQEMCDAFNEKIKKLN
jgi:hypothetical protein